MEMAVKYTDGTGRATKVSGTLCTEVHPPSYLPCLAPSLSPTLRVPIFPASHPRALVQALASVSPAALLPTVGSLSSFSLSCSATSSEKTSPPSHTHSLSPGTRSLPTCTRLHRACDLPWSRAMWSCSQCVPRPSVRERMGG